MIKFSFRKSEGEYVKSSNYILLREVNGLILMDGILSNDSPAGASVLDSIYDILTLSQVILKYQLVVQISKNACMEGYYRVIDQETLFKLR